MVKMIYRKAKKGVAEQYAIHISKKIIEEMNITNEDREVEVSYDEKEKVIKIKKKIKMRDSDIMSLPLL